MPRAKEASSLSGLRLEIRCDLLKAQALIGSSNLLVKSTKYSVEKRVQRVSLLLGK